MKKDLTVYGCLYLKNGIGIDLDGQKLKEVKVDPDEIEDYGVRDVGDEANIYIPEIKKVVKGLENVKKLFKSKGDKI